MKNQVFQLKSLPRYLAFAILLFTLNLGAETRPVKIGYLLDLSAKGAFVGLQSQAGAELARRELAESGLNISIVYEDHRAQGPIAVASAKKLLEVDKVDGFLCDMTSACIPASPVIKRANKVVMYQSPAVSILSSNPYAFKNFLDYEDGCRQIAQYWKKRGFVKIAHFKANAEYGELCLKGSREIFPVQEVFEYNIGDDLRPLVTKLKDSGTQAVFQTGLEGDYINRFRAASDMGVNIPSGFPQPLLTEAVLKAVKPAALAGSVVFGFSVISKAFLDKLKAAGLFRSDANSESAAIGYMHMKQLALSIIACPDGDVSCQVARIAKSAADPVLEFQGWTERAATYKLVLREWKQGRLIDVN